MQNASGLYPQGPSTQYTFPPQLPNLHSQRLQYPLIKEYTLNPIMDQLRDIGVSGLLLS